MKKLLVASLLIISTLSLAQMSPEFKEVPKTVTCGPLASIVKALISQDIGETPIWIGRDEADRSSYAVFVNPKTGSFTILQFGPVSGCILGVGHKSEKF
jgi:hypothetical protein